MYIAGHAMTEVDEPECALGFRIAATITQPFPVTALDPATEAIKIIHSSLWIM